ncbi:MAG: hypothetical protein RLZZ200_502 [Pseudomonadota bacterium]|jgi:hypothetical protein
MSEKKCTDCKRTKPLGEFRAVSSMIQEKPGYAGDGFSDCCKACVRKKSKATRAARSADKSGGGAASADTPTDNAPRLHVGMQLGFRAHYNGTDVVIEQDSGEGKSTIWLSLHEDARLGEFAGSLAQKAAALPAPAVEA